MSNDELNNQNQDDLTMQDPSVPAYSARGTQNLNQAPVTPSVQPIQSAAVVQANIPQTTEATTEEALFVDLTSGEEQPEVITDIKKEGVIVDDVKKEHIAPDMNQFLAPEQGLPAAPTEEVQSTEVLEPVIQEQPTPPEPTPKVAAIVQEEVVPVVEKAREFVPNQNEAEVNPYTHEVEYENKFAGMFANQGGGDPALQETANNPQGQIQERPVLTPPPQRKPVKQKGISMGTLLMILLFVGGMIFVLFLPQISAFFGGF